jgi:hypothetical protein
MENSNKWIFHYFSKLNQIFSFLLNLQWWKLNESQAFENHTTDNSTYTWV